ncbi:MAG: DUF1257 domain-containing protein [Candidatus Lokiarchaeota archaeon]|nr:DUF1257 domain-containing protein [Candidatus Lokiarchaeota archaeon]
MSEYHVVKLDIVDKSCLLETLKEMGYSPSVYLEPKRLRGYRGDLRQQKAHIVIDRRQIGGLSNDVGFERIGGKFIMHLSEYDQRVNTFDVRKFKKMYKVQKTCSALCKNSRYRIKSKKTKKDGRIAISVEVLY